MIFRHNQRGFTHFMQLALALVVISLVAVVGVRVINSSSAATCGSYTFKQGSNGPCVEEIQSRINSVKGSLGIAALAVDGDFGPKTKAGVIAFQKHFMGPKEADGIVGPRTWSTLLKKTAFSGTKTTAKQPKVSLQYSGQPYLTRSINLTSGQTASISWNVTGSGVKCTLYKAFDGKRIDSRAVAATGSSTIGGQINPGIGTASLYCNNSYGEVHSSLGFSVSGKVRAI